MADTQKNYRLGIDLGATSLGWCMAELSDSMDVTGIIDMGVRIFPDGREAHLKQPLSVNRRKYRGQRRNLDRYLERTKSLLIYFVEHGFLPEDKLLRDDIFQLNPLELRAKALDYELNPQEFSRALIHLAKKRGFRSNRKIISDKSNKFSDAIKNLNVQLQEHNARTLGEYLWQRIRHTPANQKHFSTPIKFRYEANEEHPIPFFPTRDMVENEFNKIWESQSRFNPKFTDDHKQQIHDIIFFQRPLKPQPKGKCQLLPEYERAPKAHPLFQEFRILQDLNNLRAINVYDGETIFLDDQQHAKLLNMLSTKQKVTFKTMRKELWKKQADDYRFNLETNERKDLQGDLTRVAINTQAQDHTKAWWEQASSALKESAIALMISDLDDEPFMVEMNKLGISAELADDLLNIHLPGDYCHFSIQALNRILPHMRNRHIYSEACKMGNFIHSGEWNGTIYNEGDLPYYGEILTRETIELNRKTGDSMADQWGRINNPTVHIALNQLQKLVNTLCKRYGAPKEIVLELGKDIKLGKAEKDRMESLMNANKKQNQRIDKLLEEQGLPANHANRTLIKLWEETSKDELKRYCMYTGRQISFTDLFSHSIEIDHILPKTRTYDDSIANKILCFTAANRYKKEQSPWEAFGNSQDGYDWEEIQRRAQDLPDNKRWRFQKDAMERYENKEELISRMLNDTRYMSRVAMKYMYYVCGDSKVWTITGRHTAMLRGKWGLNPALGKDDEKERADHRHHTIDAFVIALTTRSFVKQIADRIEQSTDRFIEKLPPPFQGFSMEDFKQKINNVVVSYKPDQPSPHKLTKRGQTAGELLQDTAYGFVRKDPNDVKYAYYSKRTAIEALSIKDIAKIIDPIIKDKLSQIAEIWGKDQAQLKSRLSQWGKENNVKKVRIEFRASVKSMIPVTDKHGNPFKYYLSGENLFADIYLKDPTNPDCLWEMEIVTSYHAHQPNFCPQWKKLYPKGKRIMRLYKNDIVAVSNDEGKRVLKRVRKMDGNRLYLREINIAFKSQELQDIGEQYSPRTLMKASAAKAGVDIMGRAFDPRAEKQNADSGNQ